MAKARHVIPTGPGKTANYKAPPEVPGAILGVLYNFDINGDRVKDEHTKWLDKHIVPVLSQGGSVTIRGLASTTGDAAYNLDLSHDRMYSVQDYLMLSISNPKQIKQADYVGEAEARKYEADNVEDENWRAVQVMAWDKPAPPEFPKSVPYRATTELKIISRFFHKLKSKADRTGLSGPQSEPVDPDATVKMVNAVLELLKLGIAVNSTIGEWEVLSERRATQVPVAHEVIRLEVTTTHSTAIMFGGETEITLTRVEYTWGDTTPFVKVHEKKHDESVVCDPWGCKIDAQADHESTKFVRRKDARIDTFITPPRVSL